MLRKVRNLRRRARHYRPFADVVETRQQSKNYLSGIHDLQLINTRRLELRKQCQTCGRLLDLEADPLSADCGGDCWGCVGEFEADGWPPSAMQVAKEVTEGWRNSDGSPKPPGK
jgi:hypothetical protein